jgi:hypothetical protein
VPYQRLARFILDEWRALERRLAVIDPGSQEAAILIPESRALRDEYEHLIQQAAIHHRPVPAPFPED